MFFALLGGAAVAGLLDIPVSVYRRRLGFSLPSVTQSVVRMGRRALLLAVLGTPVALAVLWWHAAAPGWWWLQAWALVGVIVAGLVWAYPVTIAPQFDRFRPLEDVSLCARIQRLQACAGARACEIFVISRATRTAYTTGIGKSTRIVCTDALLAALGEEEVAAIVAHELGHVRHHHVFWRLLLALGVALLWLAVLGWVMTQSPPHVALALFVLASPVFALFTQPLFAWLSRRHEYQADAFAARQTSASALASALVKLSGGTAVAPDPVYSAFYDWHPPMALRLACLSRRSG